MSVLPQAVPERAGIGRHDPPLLEVRDLRVQFRLGRRRNLVRAVDGVSFAIPRGRTLGLVGPSGCGKTTVARAVHRLIPAASGSVRLDGVDIGSLSGRALRRMRRRMQMVFQDAAGSLNPRMRVGESVAEPLTIHGIGSRRERRDRARALLERVGLRAADADRYPHELSGGQRQRVGIARALALEPDLLTLDEPTSALDVSVRAQIVNLLRDLQDQLGLTYLFITHDPVMVERLCDRVVVMRAGRIVARWTGEELTRRAQASKEALYRLIVGEDTDEGMGGDTVTAP